MSLDPRVWNTDPWMGSAETGPLSPLALQRTRSRPLNGDCDSIFHGWASALIGRGAETRDAARARRRRGQICPGPDSAIMVSKFASRELKNNQSVERLSVILYECSFFHLFLLVSPLVSKNLCCHPLFVSFFCLPFFLPTLPSFLSAGPFGPGESFLPGVRCQGVFILMTTSAFSDIDGNFS